MQFHAHLAITCTENAALRHSLPLRGDYGAKLTSSLMIFPLCRFADPNYFKDEFALFLSLNHPAQFRLSAGDSNQNQTYKK
jgi:hypothetical protein